MKSFAGWFCCCHEEIPSILFKHFSFPFLANFNFDLFKWIWSACKKRTIRLLRHCVCQTICSFNLCCFDLARFFFIHEMMSCDGCCKWLVTLKKPRHRWIIWLIMKLERFLVNEVSMIERGTLVDVIRQGRVSNLSLSSQPFFFLICHYFPTCTNRDLKAKQNESFKLLIMKSSSYF